MKKIFFSEKNVQYLVGVLLLLVYAGPLFFPLMDKDAARNANVSLRMIETGEWWKLVDRDHAYLDKPHWLFWGSFIGYKLFGVSTFAVRLPHIIYVLIAVYSVYKLTKFLTDKPTAKLAALMMATAQAFVLAIVDARMETPLTAGIAFGLWQLVAYINSNKLLNLVLAALGLAVAFSTKGWIGVVIVFVAVFFYLLFSKKWMVFVKPKTYLFIPFFALFISPVLYAYYQQFDLHPELVVRGTSGHSGVKFILWQQNFERFDGDRFSPGEGGRNKDYFFLYHTFLWAFFPWSIAACAAVYFWLRRIIFKKKWRHPLSFATPAFLLILFLISFSKFKMPHYIIMLFPLAVLMTAPYLRTALRFRKSLRFYSILHLVLAIVVVLAVILLNYYFFQPANLFAAVLGPALLISFLLFLPKKWPRSSLKTILTAVGLSIVLNFYLYYSFLPNVMVYQGGNRLAAEVKSKMPDANNDLRQIESEAHSFDFYLGRNHPILVDTLEAFTKKSPSTYYLISGWWFRRLQEEGYTVEPLLQVPDYNVSTIDIKFLNPKTRASQLDTLMLARVYKK